MLETHQIDKLKRLEQTDFCPTLFLIFQLKD